MLTSMTGFGSGVFATEGISASCEIKSLNNRFFECSLRAKCPPLGEFEQTIKNRVKERVARGRVEIFLKVSFLDSSAHVISLDRGLADEYYKTFTEILDRYGLDRNVRLEDFLRLENLLDREERIPDRQLFQQALMAALDTALNRLTQMRKQEGKLLQDDILYRLDVCEGKMVEIDSMASDTPQALVEKYRSRLKKLLEDHGMESGLDEGRIVQEAAVIADKSDVTEEIIRFNSHVQQFREYLQLADPVGRSLEFLLQEMQREINTISSKSADSRISRLSVEVRSELEKIREQVQNVE
ncbi:YicC family protein [Desulfurispirillum indicum]|uniref:YicC/YloC family endoribonuclease n=1 Tax=Desulfurispirillum indicum TaxID=936456 RepID=UPI001CFAEC77|nr:YicC/YloC family endoribonuclease [Desulfurispirillum indicum]UCZ56452.1 YicC family protein [Desulfurispirillum indicum]